MAIRTGAGRADQRLRDQPLVVGGGQRLFHPTARRSPPPDNASLGKRAALQAGSVARGEEKKEQTAPHRAKPAHFIRVENDRGSGRQRVEIEARRAERRLIGRERLHACDGGAVQ